jgi:hypothetical protein
MIVNFRHGIVSCATSPLTGQPDILNPRGSTVDLTLVGGTPIVFTIAHGLSNYLFTIEQPVPNAWVNFGTPQYPNGIDYNLFIDIHPVTGAMSFGQTRYPTHIGKSAPQSPNIDQHWYDTQNFKTKVWNGAVWVEKIRLFVGKYINTSTILPQSRGSQIGIQQQTLTGKVIYSDSGRPVKKSTGEFFTTEDSIFVNGQVNGPNSLDTRLITVQAGETIPKSSIVKFTSFDTVVLATYEDTDNAQLAFAKTSATTGQTLEIVLQGVVENAAWNFASPNDHVWVSDSGQVSAINPGIDNPSRAAQPPIGRVVGVNSIRFMPPVVGMQVIGQLGFENGGTGASTQQGALNNIAGEVTARKFLRGNGTNVGMSFIEVDDVPILNQNTTGSARSLETGRTITISGDVSIAVPPFDGTSNLTATATLANTTVVPGTYTKITVDSKGRTILGANPTTLLGYGITDAQPLSSTLLDLDLASPGIVVKTSPIASATREITVSGIGLTVADGNGVNGNPVISVNSTSSSDPNTIVSRDAFGNFAASTITAISLVGELVGNSATATRIDTPKWIEITGDINWSVQFDGSMDVTASSVLPIVNDDVGTYGSQSQIAVLTVNEKGQVLGAGTVDVPDGQLTIATSGNGLSGTGVFTANQLSNNTITIASNATSLATSSTIVFRDALGNFATNSISAISLSGELSGNASTATSLQTARTIEIVGSATGSVMFDGTTNVAIELSPSENSIELGTHTSGNYVATIVGGTGVTVTGSGSETAAVSIAIGQPIAPTDSPSFTNLTVTGDLIVTGTTTSINAQNLTIQDAVVELANGNTSGVVPYIGILANRGVIDAYWLWDEANDRWFAGTSTDGSSFTLSPIQASEVIATTLTGTLSGNAATATALATARTISITGDGTGVSAPFDGTAPASIPFTLTATGVSAGTYGSTTLIPSITIDSKGRVTSASNNSITVGNGTLTIETSGIGITGTGSFSANQTSNDTITITSNATSSTIANTLVSRNGSGDFSARKISLTTQTNAITQSSPMNLEVVNSGGTGDANVAGISFNCTSAYATHLSLRNDGVIGLGGWSASAWRWYVQMSTGTMTAAGDVVAYSDPRLKTEIVHIDSALAKVKQLNGVRFKWVDSDVVGNPGKYDYGILADEVYKVAPELVHDSMHTSPDGDKYKTVAYDKLIPFLIEAVKEQQTEIDDLKTQVNDLMSLVHKLVGE